MGARDEDLHKELPPPINSLDTERSSQEPSDYEADRDQPPLSVAIKRNRSGKTKVTAKGSGEVAEQILQIAFDQGVKVRTDSDLAQILANVDLESEIPLEALTAVATILNYVYDEQKKHQKEPVRQP